MSNFFIKIIQNIILRRVKNHRVRNYVSITNAKKVGFIFNVNEKGIEEAIPVLEKNLQTHGVDFQGVAIDLSETQEGVPKFQSDPYIINLYKSDTNWIGIPSHELLTKFINSDFDIFLDLTIEKVFPLDYILEHTNSKVIVGFCEKKASKYDILIKASNDSTQPGLSEYVINTIEYLTTIKSN